MGSNPEHKTVRLPCTEPVVPTHHACDARIQVVLGALLIRRNLPRSYHVLIQIPTKIPTVNAITTGGQEEIHE